MLEVGYDVLVGKINKRVVASMLMPLALVKMKWSCEVSFGSCGFW